MIDKELMNAADTYCDRIKEATGRSSDPRNAYIAGHLSLRDSRCYSAIIRIVNDKVIGTDWIGDPSDAVSQFNELVTKTKTDNPSYQYNLTKNRLRVTNLLGGTFEIRLVDCISHE